MRQLRSSGDATADRRFAYAMGYKAAGDLSAAAELVEQALECAPGWAAGWFALGDLRESCGGLEQAGAAYHRSLALDPEDIVGAGARLARLGEIPAAGAMTASHVSALFDEYAPRFERSLVGDLNYRGPALLRSVLAMLRQPLSFGRTLDLGCGTGLAGAALQDVCAEIEGCDLSQAMLAYADMKLAYRKLTKKDVAAFLEDETSGSADLIVAADVFVYLSDLAVLFRQVARVLQPGGLFAFSAQSHDGPERFILNHDARYAHSHHGIDSWAAEASLRILHRNEEWARLDRGVPVPGMIVVLGK